MNNGDDKGMKEIILVKYGEMALKGLNKRTFEDVLVKNIKKTSERSRQNKYNKGSVDDFY